MESDEVGVHVTCELRAVGAPMTVDEFHERGVALMDQLVELEDADPEICDVTIGGSGDRMVWDVEMVVRTDDQFHALVRALVTIRTALHQMGEATPGWPTADDVRRAFLPSVVH